MTGASNKSRLFYLAPYKEDKTVSRRTKYYTALYGPHSRSKQTRGQRSVSKSTRWLSPDRDEMSVARIHTKE